MASWGSQIFLTGSRWCGNTAISPEWALKLRWLFVSGHLIGEVIGSTYKFFVWNSRLWFRVVIAWIDFIFFYFDRDRFGNKMRGRYGRYANDIVFIGLERQVCTNARMWGQRATSYFYFHFICKFLRTQGVEVIDLTPE